MGTEANATVDSKVETTVIETSAKEVNARLDARNKAIEELKDVDLDTHSNKYVKSIIDKIKKPNMLAGFIKECKATSQAYNGDDNAFDVKVVFPSMSAEVDFDNIGKTVLLGFHLDANSEKMVNSLVEIDPKTWAIVLCDCSNGIFKKLMPAKKLIGENGKAKAGYKLVKESDEADAKPATFKLQGHDLFVFKRVNVVEAIEA